MPKPLATAILHWKRGLPLPTDIAAALDALGLDIAALEARYSH